MVHFDYFIHRTDEIVNEVTGKQPNLEYLNFNNSYTITDVGVESVKHCKRLKQLSLYRCPKITDVGIQNLTMHCTELKILDLSLCK